jgi:hypothetical protein
MTRVRGVQNYHMFCQTLRVSCSPIHPSSLVHFPSFGPLSLYGFCYTPECKLLMSEELLLLLLLLRLWSQLEEEEEDEDLRSLLLWLLFDLASAVCSWSME